MADSDDSSRSHYYAEQNVQTAVGAAMIALSIFFVALRFYVRMQFNKAPLGWDDWLALAALVATVAAGLLVLMGMLNISVTKSLVEGTIQVAFWSPECPFSHSDIRLWNNRLGIHVASPAIRSTLLRRIRQLIPEGNRKHSFHCRSELVLADGKYRPGLSLYPSQHIASQAGVHFFHLLLQHRLPGQAIHPVSLPARVLRVPSLPRPSAPADDGRRPLLRGHDARVHFQLLAVGVRLGQHVQPGTILLQLQ